MPQILGVEGEAVVLYREPSTTQEMRYPRLSRRVNKMALFLCFQDATCSGFEDSIKNNEIARICSFLAYVAILFMQLRGRWFDVVCAVYRTAGPNGNATTLLRPLSLALYNASSALAIKASGEVSSPGIKVDTPKLTVT